MTKLKKKMSCCGQITTVRVPIELNNQSDVLKVCPATGDESGDELRFPKTHTTTPDNPNPRLTEIFARQTN